MPFSVYDSFKVLIKVRNFFTTPVYHFNSVLRTALIMVKLTNYRLEALDH